MSEVSTFPIAGMHCSACVQRLAAAFQRLPGVRSVHVTLVPPEAHIEADAGVSMDALNRAAKSAGSYSVGGERVGATAPMAVPGATAAPPDVAEPQPSLFPLGLIVAFIAAIAALTTYVRGDGSVHTLMLDFMAGFFLVFAFFKLLDIRGFADAYQSYDIIAQRSRPYALAYPFIEVALGVAYLTRWQPTITNWAALALMLVGSVGVLRAVLGKRRIRCACLGTALNLPMTTVTLVEDLGMAAMAATALIWEGSAVV